MAGKVMAYVIKMERYMGGYNEGIKFGKVRLSLVDQSSNQPTHICGVAVNLFTRGWMTKIVSRK